MCRFKIRWLCVCYECVGVRDGVCFGVHFRFVAFLMNFCSYSLCIDVAIYSCLHFQCSTAWINAFPMGTGFVYRRACECVVAPQCVTRYPPTQQCKNITHSKCIKDFVCRIHNAAMHAFMHSECKWCFKVQCLWVLRLCRACFMVKRLKMLGSRVGES